MRRCDLRGKAAGLHRLRRTVTKRRVWVSPGERRARFQDRQSRGDADCVDHADGEAAVMQGLEEGPDPAGGLDDGPLRAAVPQDAGVSRPCRWRRCRPCR